MQRNKLNSGKDTNNWSRYNSTDGPGGDRFLCIGEISGSIWTGHEPWCYKRSIIQKHGGKMKILWSINIQ